MAAILLIGIGLAHSYLGERYILIRLFRTGHLPKLFGGTEFTQNTLRFAWHLTTLAWFGFAVILIQFTDGEIRITIIGNIIGNIIGTVFVLHALMALVGSRGKHFAWPVFLVIGLATFYGVNA